MPTYNYSCDKCDNTFEEQLPIAQRKVPEGRCMECNDGDVRQMIVAPGFAYDNIKTKHSVKPAAVSQLNDRLKDIKSRHPGNTL